MIVPPASKPPGSNATTLNAIRGRAEAVGVDAGFLQTLARVESSLKPDLRARTSTAAGLFQFIEATWLDLLHRHGAKHGLDAAGLVVVDSARTGSGRFQFASAAQRQQALDLRFDPSASAALAAEYVRENATLLADTLNRPPRAVDLYLTHFLGSNDARRFLRELERAPGADAAHLFPAPAAANRGVFFDRDGAPRSLRAIYDRFAARFPAPVESQSVAAEPAPAAAVAVAGAFPQPGGAPPRDWRVAAMALLTLRLDWPDDADD